jgi:hypothetical protein
MVALKVAERELIGPGLYTIFPTRLPRNLTGTSNLHRDSQVSKAASWPRSWADSSLL